MFGAINSTKISEGRRSLTLKFSSENWNTYRSLAQNQLSAVQITDHTDFYLLQNQHERFLSIIRQYDSSNVLTLP